MTSDAERLLVVTVTRGESPHWPATAQSIREAWPDATHLVVAPENKLAAVSAVAPGVVVVPEVPGGLYPNINHALRVRPEEPLVTWLNDDDVLMAPGAENARAHLGRRPDVDFCYGRVAIIDGAGDRRGELPIARTAADLVPLIGRGIMPLAQPGTLIRRTAWEALGGVDESFRLAADLDLFARAGAAGMRFSHWPETVAAFRLRAGQLSKDADTAKREDIRARRSLSSAPRSLAAWWRFRWQNRAVYWERLCRHGPKSMRTLYREVT